MAINKQIIEVQIDELVLHGFKPNERFQIAAELETELSRLFTERGLPASFHNTATMEQLNASAFQVNNTNKKISTGSQIAGSVYDSFSAVNHKAVK
jgi:hypothetical protein